MRLIWWRIGCCFDAIEGHFDFIMVTFFYQQGNCRCWRKFCHYFVSVINLFHCISLISVRKVMFLLRLCSNFTLAGVEVSSEQKKSSVSSTAFVSKPSNTSITDVIESVVSAAREDDTSKDSASSISKSGMNGLCPGFCEHPVACHAVAVRRIRSRLSERSCWQLLRFFGVNDNHICRLQ